MIRLSSRVPNIEEKLFTLLSDNDNEIIKIEKKYIIKKNQEIPDGLETIENEFIDEKNDIFNEAEPLTIYLSSESESDFISRIKLKKIGEKRYKLNDSLENNLNSFEFEFTDDISIENIKFESETLQIKQNAGLQEILLAAVYKSRFPDIEILLPPDIQSNILDIKIKTNELTIYSKLINKIILGRKPSAGFNFLKKLNILSLLLPELEAAIGVTQNKYHMYDVYEHSLLACDAIYKPDFVLRWAALLHDIGKVLTRKEKDNSEASFYNHEYVSARLTVKIMKRFGIKKETGLKIKFLVRNHMFHYTNEWTDRAVRRFLKRVPRENLEDLITLRMADRKASGRRNAFPTALQNLIEHIDEVYANELKLKVIDLDITGFDLMDLGVKAGPEMGKILNILLEEVKSKNLINEKEKLIEKVKTLI
ncbi:MAG: HD domain-containing protein [Spirochaetia bacterium]|nr:HD domain-containing protein [Spirochaetia bacterium]